MIYKTYKYRMYPNKEQERVLAKYFGSVRFVYNHFLAERKKQYDENGKSDNYYAQAKTLTLLKKKEDLSLKDRNWKCPHCGQMIDRDLNASINILNEGIKSISAGTVDYTEGADVRPTRRQSAMKSEAHESLVRG